MIRTFLFEVVLLSNIVQGFSVSIIKRHWIIETGEREEADSQWMRDEYTPLGFDRERSKQ